MITDEEIQADDEAEQAMKLHKEFRDKHWAYFYGTERFDSKTGRLIPRIRNEALERESGRLFSIARSANKRALDLEYKNKS